MSASFDGHVEVVQTLIEAGAPINTQREACYGGVHTAIEYLML